MAREVQSREHILGEYRALVKFRREVLLKSHDMYLKFRSRETHGQMLNAGAIGHNPFYNPNLIAIKRNWPTQGVKLHMGQSNGMSDCRH